MLSNNNKGADVQADLRLWCLQTLKRGASKPISYGHKDGNMSDAHKTTLFVIPSQVLQGHVAQSLMCLTADPGIASSIRPGLILALRLIM